MAKTQIPAGYIAANAITATEIAANSITAAAIASDAIVVADIADNSITSAKIAANAVDSAELVSGSIDTVHIADSQVTNAKLANSSVTVNSNAVSLGSSITLDTDDIGEGSTNLYYTNARADARIAAATTDDLTEGASNLYFTNARVDSHLSGGTGVTFSSGVISIGQDVGTTSTPTFGNITTTGYIAGPATFTIDPAAVGDNTGTVVIAGNLQVDGTTTTINSTTVNIDDLNIQLATGAINAAAANGAGITVDGASATFTYNSGNDDWNINKTLRVENSGSLLRKYVSAWSYPIHDIIYSSYLANTGDYTYLKAAGNSAGPHGALITGDSVFAVGTTDVELGGMVNSATAPLTNTWLYANSSGLNINGDLTTTGDVGIGTTSPSRPLHSYSSSVGTVLKLDSAGVDTGMEFAHSGTVASAINSSSGGDLEFRTGANSGANERMRIDSSGNVGVGTSSPTRTFEVNSGTTNNVARFESTDAGAFIDFKDNTGIASIGNSGTNLLFYPDAATEAMRIDSSGNLLVGKTSDSFSVAGIGLRGTVADFTRDGNTPINVNRLTSDGEVIKFHKDDTLIGSINATGGDLTIGTGDTGIRFVDASSSIQPINTLSDARTDNTIDLGSGTYRFKDGHFSGTVNAATDVKINGASAATTGKAIAMALVFG